MLQRRTAIEADNAPEAGNFRSACARIGANYPNVVLLLQGGGALGSYQAGVFEVLEESGIEVNWVAGISIGAINAAIIAGNPPGERVAKLRAFWDRISGNVRWPAVPPGDDWRLVLNYWASWLAITSGAAGFFQPRFPLPQFAPRGSDSALSYYDTTPLKETLEEFVDFDRLNNGPVRLSVGAVNLRSGNFVYFDTIDRVIRPEHIMASGALPPGFPPVEIENELYWDGGLVSNTPLQHVFTNLPREDTLLLQVDLFSARGPRPRTIEEVEERAKDIRFSSRTRLNSDVMADFLRYRKLVGKLIALLPDGLKDSPEVAAIENETHIPKLNLIQLIYRRKLYDAAFKDYEFSWNTMQDHWYAGYATMKRTLRHPNWFELPDSDIGFARHDVDASSKD
jgi:NTE family protein